MSSEKSVSFRSHLLANTTDLLGEVDLHCARTARLIVSIISQLAAYTEEGAPLAPTVFICNSVSNLIQRAGAGEYVPLSGVEAMDGAAGRILKAAAPLCSSGWRIYIERLNGGEQCRFGVFCGSSDPTALTIDEIVLDQLEPGFPVVRISQSVTNKVEVKTNTGDAIEFRFNDDADLNDIGNIGRISELSKTIASKTGEQSVLFSEFIARLLHSAIRDSHGTIIAVTENTGAFPVALKDAIVLDPPLDLFERYRLHFAEEKTAISVSRLQMASQLLSGFVRSDGITVLDQLGRVLGYRAFVRIDNSATNPMGGARTRAFGALVNLLGTELAAVFFRSEDGRMELKLSGSG